MNNVCVFCGSNSGLGSAYTQAASRLGALLAEKKVGLVYGGANIGVMGCLADSALANGGSVTGVIPESIAKLNVSHTNLTDLRVVATMHERKALMAELSDGFISLPGGLGTLEEMFEVLTWAQLSIHDKPCGLLNINGYFDKLLDFMDNMVAQQFVVKAHRDMLICESSEARLLEAMNSYKPPVVKKW